MSSPGPLYRPYDKLVKIQIMGREFEVPEGNMMLRAMQYLAPEAISYGRFCWNEDCQYCRVEYDMGEGTPRRVAISCKLMVKEGMRIVEMAQEIRYCLRGLKLQETSFEDNQQLKTSE
jgi:predicted molibdopterin-dependent oxidoreductase YjgC